MEPLILLQGVHEVASLANPQAPEEVSQRAFDETRSQSATFPNLPRAKHIAEQIGKPWREVLDIALAPQSTHSKRLGSIQSSPEQDWLTEEYVAYILNNVARRLNVSTVSPSQYRTEREKMLKADRADWLHGGHRLLPTDEQIRTACGSWDMALAVARLQARPKPSGTATGTGGDKQTIPTRIEVIERFHEHYGVQPTREDLAAFARGNGIPVSDEGKRNWTESIAAWRQQRQERGLPAPQGISRPRGRRPRNAPALPDYSRDVGAAKPDEQLYRGKWSEAETCAAWVARYLTSLGPRERSTLRGYADWARQQDGAPAASIFEQHGGWEAIRRQAQAVILSAGQPSSVH